jgi:hypothetical protein
LSAKNHLGRTPYHYAANSGTLGDLPPAILQRSDLLLEDNRGWTPLHEAAAAGMLDAVPRGIIQPQDLEKQWQVPFGPGVSVQETAERAGCGDQAQRLVAANSATSHITLLSSLPADAHTGGTSAAKCVGWVM